MTLLEEAQANGWLLIDTDKRRIRYPHVNKEYNYTNPEELVRAETFATLVRNYGCPVKRIDVEGVGNTFG